MAKKTFKIGEYAIGGIISVETKGKVILVKALDWNSREELMSGSAMADEPNAHRKLFNFLNELTSSYYADKVLEWIKSKVEIKDMYAW